jgi:GDSL-like Lipase/Acylhydrolase family
MGTATARKRSISAGASVALLVASVVGATIFASASARAASVIAKGDLAVSLPTGVDEYTPTGTFVQHLITSSDGLVYPTGSAFDGNGNLYVTDFSGDRILRRDALTGAVTVAASDATLGNGHTFNAPESIVFNKGYTQMYVSDANRGGPGGGINIVDTSTGAGAGFYPLPTSSGSLGMGESDWLALDANSNLYMTNENPSQGIMKVDQTTGDIVQPSLVSSLPDDGYALSFDKNGNLWVGDTTSILKYGADGTPLKTITNTSFNLVFSAVFNATGDQFYAGDLGNGNVYTYDLNGNLLNSFNAGGGVSGLSVSGAFVPPNIGSLGKYVALGDSYSSGEGAIDGAGDPSFITDTNLSKVDECHRSLNAYPELLSTEPAVNAIPAGYTFSACSGARVANFVKKLPGDGGWNEGPQIDKIASPGQQDTKTGLITLSVGGNDAGFVPDLQACIHGFGRGFSACRTQITNRLEQATQLLTAGGLVHYNLGNMDNWHFCLRCNPLNRNVVDVPSLHSLYSQIHKRAPNAEIRVVGYPQLFPKSATSACVVGTFVNRFNQSLKYKLEPWEMTALYNAEVSLNSTIQAQVALLKAKGVNITYVDTFSSFAGHGPCDSPSTSTQWINGLMFKSFLTSGAASYSFHPNAAGQAKLESLVLGAL